MKWMAGVDEAGYGPTLGPLVVSLVAIRGEVLDADGWKFFGRAAVKRPGRRGSGAVVGDSKVVYRSGEGPAGLVALETTVLAFLTAMGCEPVDLDSYLGAVAPGALQALPSYPWYCEHALSLPVAAEGAAVSTAAGRIRKAIRQRNVRLAVRACPVFERDYNALCDKTDNKSEALFEVFAGLLSTLREWSIGENAALVVDRHGGRAFYAPLLQRAWPEAFVAIEREEGGRSDYRLFCSGRTVRICFREKADSLDFSVALASMISKYTRELFMTLFNRYWCGRQPSLKPTAGYATDATRFLNDIAPEVERLGIDRGILVRAR